MPHDSTSKTPSDKEIERRRDEALKRALGMPHKPHKDEPKRREPPSKKK